MRHISRRFPNGVTVWVERLSGGDLDYEAIKNGKPIGSYRIKESKRRASKGKLMGQRYRGFYGWLRAARGA